MLPSLKWENYVHSTFQCVFAMSIKKNKSLQVFIMGTIVAAVEIMHCTMEIVYHYFLCVTIQCSS